jgi:hypothetical protein
MLFAAGDGFVETGPFRVESETRELTRLARRGSSKIDRIDIVPVSGDAEWRLLHAGELDVIPLVDARQRDEFRGLSVRVLDIASVLDVTLFFNPWSETFASTGSRASFRDQIERGPIALVACGSVECAVDDAVPPETTGPLPRRVVAGVPKGRPVFLLAANVLRQQLHASEVTVEVRELGVTEYGPAWRDGTVDLYVMPLPRSGPDRYQNVAVAMEDAEAEGVDAFRGAVAAADWARAESILQEQALVAPLFQFRHIAVVDEELCGAVTPESDSWRWIAELHPCSEGER